MIDVPHPDLISVLWFFAAWAGYTLYADHSRHRHLKLTAIMNEYRHSWMLTMLARELRIIDTSIVGNIITGVAFFASTTIFVIGGLLATIGSGETAINAVQALPFSSPTSRTLFELKILLLVAIFIYAFFKLAWAFRLYNNCSVLIGAAPLPPLTPDAANDYADVVSELLGLATRHFNLGMRAYFFAMAAFAWLLNPAVFMLATSVVVAVVYRREFRSRTVRAVRGKIRLATRTGGTIDTGSSADPR